MPPKIDPVSPDRKLNVKEAAGVTAAARWINRSQKPRLDEAGVVHFDADQGQPFIVTAVDHITTIFMAPHEIIIPPLHLGDTDNWKAKPAISGSGSKMLASVLVKPSDAGLSTNIVIETNKRSINAALSSRRADYMPKVSLDMADDDGWNSPVALTDPATVASPCDQAPTIPPDQFRISGDRTDWRPLQVWAVSTPVGMKTCVEFPAGIGSSSLPALFALDDDGGWFSSPTKDIVNVRFVKRRFVVDELLNRFVLVEGVGGSQRSVSVTRG
jgi:type IV secretion system protein TrbG